MTLTEKILFEFRLSTELEKYRAGEGLSLKKILKDYCPEAHYDQGSADHLFHFINQVHPEYNSSRNKVFAQYGRPEKIKISNLIFSQTYVYMDGSYSDDKPIQVIRVKEGDFICDGNHRIVQALLAGKEYIDALVIKLNI